MNARSLARRAALAVILSSAALGAAGCLDDLVQPPDTGKGQGGKPELHAEDGRTEVRAGRTELAGTSTRATATSTRTGGAAVTKAGVEVETTEKGPPVDCKRDVKWTHITRCQHDGVLYATGVVSGVQDVGLARSAAADRARRALVPPEKAKVLEESEVVDFVRCFGTAYALARVKLPADAGSVPACDLGALASKSPLDPTCPEWVRATAWKSEGTISGVGAAKLRNSSLADATAAARARTEIARLVHEERTTSTATRKPDADGHVHTEATTTEAESQAYSEIGRERAVCGGVTYVKIVARGTGGDPCATHK